MLEGQKSGISGETEENGGLSFWPQEKGVGKRTISSSGL